jgi:hypothetical protein
MQVAGATAARTGEQWIKDTVPTAVVIPASLIVSWPGGMLGEMTAGIAGSILDASGRQLLLPLNRAQMEIMGAEALSWNI